MYLPNYNYKRKKYKTTKAAFLGGRGKGRKWWVGNKKKGVEGIHRIHETGFLTGRDLTK